MLNICRPFAAAPRNVTEVQPGRIRREPHVQRRALQRRQLLPGLRNHGCALQHALPLHPRVPAHDPAAWAGGLHVKHRVPTPRLCRCGAPWPLPLHPTPQPPSTRHPSRAVKILNFFCNRYVFCVMFSLVGAGFRMDCVGLLGAELSNPLWTVAVARDCLARFICTRMRCMCCSSKQLKLQPWWHPSMAHDVDAAAVTQDLQSESYYQQS